MYVIWRTFIIASTSLRIVLNVTSLTSAFSSTLLCVVYSNNNYSFQKLPCQGAPLGMNFHLMAIPVYCIVFLGAAMKVVPLSETLVSDVPWSEINLLNTRTKVSVDKSFTSSKCNARTVPQVNRQIYILWVGLFVLTNMGPT